MAILQNSIIPAAAAADDEVVTKSCRFDGTSYLTHTPGSAGTRTAWTVSCWVKRCKLGSDQIILHANNSGAYEDFLRIADDDTMLLNFQGGTEANLRTVAVFRDTSAWYHVVWRYSGDTVSLYVNNVAQTLTGTQPTSYSSQFNNDVLHTIGRAPTVGGRYYADFYLADFYLIEGYNDMPSAFAESDSNGQWVPTAYTGVSTVAVHLDFNVAPGTVGGAGTDVSGNANHFSETNLNPSDQVSDRPTNSYATLNPLDIVGSATLSNGNLSASALGIVNSIVESTIYINIAVSDKFYAEILIGANGVSHGLIGIGNTEGTLNTYADTGRTGLGLTGNLYHNGGGAESGVWDGASVDDVVGILLGDGKLYVYVNGVAADDGNEGDALKTGLTGDYGIFVTRSSSFASPTYSVNYGQDPTFGGLVSTTPVSEGGGLWAYAAPSGALAISTANLPTPPIADGTEHFDTLLYTGDAATTHALTGVGFQPDIVWIKTRSIVKEHKLFDSVRGSDFELEPDTTDAEYDYDGSSTALKSFDSDGFTVGSGGAVNATGVTHAAWNWKGGTAGSEGSGVDWAENFNAPAGFSIVKWTGDDDAMGDTSQTVSHTLGAAPDFIIAKPRTNNAGGAGSWIVYHKALPSGYFLRLNTTGAKFDGTQGMMSEGLINTIGSTSVAFASDSSSESEYLNYGGDPGLMDADTYIAYLFSEVAGYSKFGSYGSSDYPFVWCGFRPAFLMLKNIDGSHSWAIQDSARDTYNYTIKRLYPDSSAIEQGGELESTYGIDFLSNGFKIRANHVSTSDGSSDFIFAAFASKPFKYSSGR